MCEGTCRVSSVSLRSDSSMSLNQREKVSPLTSSRSCSAILLQTNGSSPVGGSLSTVTSRGILLRSCDWVGELSEGCSEKKSAEQRSGLCRYVSGTLVF